MTSVNRDEAGQGSWTWAVALDGGTTNTRARLVHRDGRILATARREAGVRDTVVDDRPGRTPAEVGSGPGPGRRAILAEAVRQTIEEVLEAVPGGERPVGPDGLAPDLIVAAGMLSSEVGLASVPHVIAPAGLDELADAVEVRHLDEVSSRPIRIVPGVRTPPGPGVDGWMQADVMRGEECETLGAYHVLAGRGELDPEAPGHLFLWPGSHTKLVEVDRAGRICRSHTTLAGEVLQAVARHTLVAASLPEALPTRLDEAASAAGERAALAYGLERAAFLVRIAALGEALDPLGRASFWIAAVVAADVANLARHPILARPWTIWVGGREPLRRLYAARLSACHAGAVRPLGDEVADLASAWGAVWVARRQHERSGG